MGKRKEKIKKLEKKAKKIAVPVGAIALCATGVGGVVGTTLLKGGMMVGKAVKPVVSAVTTRVISKKLRPDKEAEVPEEQIISVVNKEIAARSTEQGQLQEVSPYLINPALANPIIKVANLQTAENVKRELTQGAQFLTPQQIAKASEMEIDIPHQIQEEVLAVRQPQEPALTKGKLPILPLVIVSGLGIGVLALTKRR